MRFNVTPSPSTGVSVWAQVVHLSAAGVSVVLDLRDGGLPRVVHWGAALGDLAEVQLQALADAAVPAIGPNAIDQPLAVSVVPEHSRGWLGQPGLAGHRSGKDWSTRFEVRGVHIEDGGASGGQVDVAAYDDHAELSLRLRLVLEPSGLCRLQATVHNEGVEPYLLSGLSLALPVPAEANEILDLAGRWARERAPQRSSFGVGRRSRENRRGRTGADASIVFAAGASGFGFGNGEVWGIHLGWSGNHRLYAERLSSGESVLGAGELLHSGEVELAEGEEYTTPWLHCSYGRGLDEVSARFHEHLRSRPNHPTRRRPRPVVLNTWEAVYFDHDLDRLKALADAGAEVGVERYVLDDGWFRRRRNDHAGLGDWYVDESVWPDGLHPLVDHVRSLGIEFGLWVEPEMINPDSDLARAHPDWILQTGGRLPVESRFQQVLDLTNPDAYAYILERLDTLLTEYPIGYLKWDHNRDLIDAGRGASGEAAVHGQTLAVYRLMAALRSRHPDLEIESCSSGGARVDLGVLAHTDRVWASDCIDPLERQQIQRWTELLLPPELIGSHVGSPHSHTTGRRHDLSFRAGTALFAHFGIEWDISRATPQERAELAAWVDLYKHKRDMLHAGRVVRGDHPDPALWVHGVVSADRAEAIFALVAMQTPLTAPPGRVRLPGLNPDLHYRVEPLAPGDAATGAHGQAKWWQAGGVTLSGRALSEVGIQAPAQHPDHLVLIQLNAQTHIGQEVDTTEGEL